MDITIAREYGMVCYKGLTIFSPSIGASGSHHFQAMAPTQKGRTDYQDKLSVRKKTIEFWGQQVMPSELDFKTPLGHHKGFDL